MLLPFQYLSRNLSAWMNRWPFGLDGDLIISTPGETVMTDIGVKDYRDVIIEPGATLIIETTEGWGYLGYSRNFTIETGGVLKLRQKKGGAFSISGMLPDRNGVIRRPDVGTVLSYEYEQSPGGDGGGVGGGAGGGFGSGGGGEGAPGGDGDQEPGCGYDPGGLGYDPGEPDGYPPSNGDQEGDDMPGKGGKGGRGGDSNGYIGDPGGEGGEGGEGAADYYENGQGGFAGAEYDGGTQTCGDEGAGFGGTGGGGGGGGGHRGYHGGALMIIGKVRPMQILGEIELGGEPGTDGGAGFNGGKSGGGGAGGSGGKLVIASRGLPVIGEANINVTGALGGSSADGSDGAAGFDGDYSIIY